MSYAESLNIGTQKDKTINFDNNDIYDEEKFTSFMIKIFKKIGIIIERGSNPYLFIEQDVLYNNHRKKNDSGVCRNRSFRVFYRCADF